MFCRHVFGNISGGFRGISRDFAEIPEFRGSATARNIRSPGDRHARGDAKAWESLLAGHSTKITRCFVTFAGCMQKIKTLLGATRAAQILKVQLSAVMSIRVSTRMLKQRLHCAKHSRKHVRSCWWTGSGNYHCNEGYLLACQRRSCHPQVFLPAWPFLRKFIFT